MSGCLIVFEGIDGTGKGTVITKALNYLSGKNPSVVYTKDPGGTPLGKSIRRVMYEEVPTTQMAEGVVDLLFLASHLQNWQTIVRPALEDDKIVVCDRWWYSEAAYMSRRTVPQPIADAYEGCHGRPADLMIFLYGDVKTVLDRARRREDETHQSAKAWNDYKVLEEIQQEYCRQFSNRPEWFPICVDNKDPEQVWEEVRIAIDTRLFER
jgi:dTMP kinase